jgi:hypothetical protein
MKPNQLKVSRIDTANWKGDWERTAWQAGGGITIKSFKGNKFSFEVQAANGTHTGEIEGEATLLGDSAVYISDEEKGCRLVFSLAPDRKKITLGATKECAVYAGNAVYFDGDYLKDPPKKVETLTTLDVLSSDQDICLRKLVDSSYDRYVECTQLVDDQDKDIDNLNTKVIKSGVVGSYSSMTYIIMIDKKCRIWTAVVDESVIHYYTNSNLFKDHLPKTIENWYEEFKEDSVIYHNK